MAANEAHLHGPATWQALGSRDRPIWLCSCGAQVVLDKATGRFNPVLGIATEHSIEDPFTGEATVQIRL